MVPVRQCDDYGYFGGEACPACATRGELILDERGVYVLYHEFEAPDADLTIDADEIGPEEAARSIEREIENWIDESDD